MVFSAVKAVKTDVRYGSQYNKFDQPDLQFFQNILKNGGIDINHEQINNHKTDILFVGKLVDNKGAEVLIRAFSKLRRHNLNNNSLTIVGSGDKKQQLAELVEELGICRHVKREF